MKLRYVKKANVNSVGPERNEDRGGKGKFEERQRAHAAMDELSFEKKNSARVALVCRA